jgi:hypothetical protein
MLTTRRAILGLALLLAAMGDASGQSQRRAQQVRVKQPETAVTQEKSHEDERGTEQSPLIVKVAPAPKTDDERAEETKERARIANADRKKEESDAKLVEFTGELAFFTKSLFLATAALVIATLGLGVAAFRQSRDMKSSIAAANKAADAAKQSADALTATERGILIEKISSVDFKRAYSVAESYLTAQAWRFATSSGTSPGRSKLIFPLRSHSRIMGKHQ